MVVNQRLSSVCHDDKRATKQSWGDAADAAPDKEQNEGAPVSTHQEEL